MILSKFLLLCMSIMSTVLSAPLVVDNDSVALSRRGLQGGLVNIGPGTYPRAVQLRDGSILVVYTAFSGGNNLLQVAKSTDGGNSFRSIGVVDQGGSSSRPVDNGFLIERPDGAIVAAFRNHDMVNGAFTFFRITTCVSTDGGVSWKFLSEVASDPGPVLGNWEPFMLYHGSTLQIYYSRENAGNDQDSLLRTSNDGGASWSGAMTISGSGITARDGMLGVCHGSGGNDLIAVFESYQGPFATINTVTSHDGGASWGERRQIYASPVGGTGTGAPQIINLGSTIVVSFMTFEDSPGKDLGSGSAMKLLLSRDGGASWGEKLTAMPVQASWPGLTKLDGNSFLALAEHAGVQAQKITI